MPSMATQSQGRDALTFQSFTEEVLEEKDHKIINEMIEAFRKNQFDSHYYISRIAILSHSRMLRDAFKRHQTELINDARRAHADDE